ncbi:tegument serine/threonine protein kinase [Corchorus olitorius]|uniref:Tegument serine/threonine protein kinase n=1 Tax=Corchorus olitorius TaxID=93759 RepID=A0A1R3J4Q8_9ROSI|nr:tegument serine/threonine protein kinase [Corchorus olitorius]
MQRSKVNSLRLEIEGFEPRRESHLSEFSHILNPDLHYVDYKTAESHEGHNGYVKPQISMGRQITTIDCCGPNGFRVTIVLVLLA